MKDKNVEEKHIDLNAVPARIPRKITVCNRTKILTIRMTHEEHEREVAWAYAHGTTLSALVRRGIELAKQECESRIRRGKYVPFQKPDRKRHQKGKKKIK